VRRADLFASTRHDDIDRTYRQSTQKKSIRLWCAWPSTEIALPDITAREFFEAMYANISTYLMEIPMRMRGK
jgi:hypothetical protein